ncbi:MAG: oligopeptide ABC transporter permease OppC [Plesiomonas sp.]
MMTKNNSAAVEQFATQLDIEGRSLWQDAFRRFKSNRAAMVSLCILALVSLYVLVAPSLSPFEFDATDWTAMSAMPAFEGQHYFGTDSLGRDLFVRMAVGGRISLMVGLAGALVAVLFGTLYGATSGYLGGRVDSLMMRVLEILNAFPFMFFVILLVTLFGRNIFLIFVAIGMVSWLDVARIVRGQTLSLKRKEFIEAALVCGVSSKNIVLRHIVPNVLGVVVIYASLLVPGMILFESFLSFLGLGVQEPMTSWGALLQDGAISMEVAVWQLLIPATFLIITLFCFNFIGDGLRDALDPKDR